MLDLIGEDNVLPESDLLLSSLRQAYDVAQAWLEKTPSTSVSISFFSKLNGFTINCNDHIVQRVSITCAFGIFRFVTRRFNNVNIIDDQGCTIIRN